MEPFAIVESKVVPLLASDVDTDQIIPARFLKVTDKRGLGVHLFSDWRYLPDGSPRPEFVLNRPEVAGAEVLLAGDNFGCGSSREHAPWALRDWGLRAVIALSFADIFQGNALKNGLLPVAIDAEAHARLRAQVEADPAAAVRIDLAAQTVTLPDGTTAGFAVEGFAKKCLLEGVDQLGYLRSHAERVAAYEAAREGGAEGAR
jgi:3-isopropylmalate/(R)-2-methylmalate dehydratase small subunit